VSDLVNRLSTGRHPIEACLRPDRTVAELKECLDRGYVHVRFTQTRGGTELGLPVDRQLSDLIAADFEKGEGRIRVVGALTLDYVAVRCVAEIDLATLQGQGWLEPVLDAAPSA
jgi:hypothetical protein